MIKIGIRYNLIFPMMFIIFNFLRKINTILMDKIIGFNGSLLLTLFMFLSEFLFGLIFYIYHLRFLKKFDINKKSTFMGIELIQAPKTIAHPDSNIKIYSFIFAITFIDFIEFMIATLYIPRKFQNLSKSLDIRLRGIFTLGSALLCFILLKFPIYRHQTFSLISIFISLIILIISEFIFEDMVENGNKRILLFVILLFFITYFFNSFIDVIEKYLLEYDFINPFKMLMLEGLFGLILTLLFCFIENPIIEVIQVKDNNETLYFILLIIFLILYFLFSGGMNAYRVTTNKLYSPMTRALCESIFAPLLIIYYYCWENDFRLKNNNLIYFIINLILSIIMVFSACVYNELFVLFCYNLEYDTYKQVSIRAKNIETNFELSLEDSNCTISDMTNESKSSTFILSKS